MTKIKGYIPQVENQRKHREFLQVVPSIDAIVIKITAARALANKGVTAEQYAEGKKVITTTTIDDRKLEDLYWSDELDIVNKFEPDYHIPADCPTYQDGDQTPLERRNNLDIYLQGLLYLEKRLEDTQLLPLIKGEKKNERKRVKEVIDHLELDYAVFYATQMMVSGMKHYSVVGKINQIANHFSNKEILVMGIQVPRYLEMMASNVVAVSGQKWRRIADPAEHETSEIVSNFQELREDIVEGLEQQKQSSLFNYSEASA